MSFTRHLICPPCRCKELEEEVRLLKRERDALYKAKVQLEEIIASMSAMVEQRKAR